METADSNPLITVIIPVYNAEKYLRRGLDSLLAQTCGNWDAVCIDDGSTDGSAAVLEEYACRDSRFRVLRQENSGVSVARNRGIQEARGEWVAFLDADDWLSEDLIEALLPHTRREKVDIIGFEAEVKFADDIEHDHQLEQAFFFKKDGEYSASPENINLMPGTCWGKAYRRAFLQENGLKFPLGMRQEDEVFYRCCMGLARHVYLLKEVGYCYYQNTDSYMHVTFNPENCFMLYLKGAGIIYDCYREHGLPIEWDEMLLGFMYGCLCRWDGKVPARTLNRFRREALGFVRRADFKDKFPNDIRLQYILYKPWWKRMFARIKEAEIVYGPFGLPLFKDCYLANKFQFRITPWSKLLKLMGENRKISL